MFQGDFGSPGVLSPDGSSVVFGAVDAEGQQRLWIRSLADGNVQVLEPTRGAFAPFWSTDGRSLGFFVDTDLRRYELQCVHVAKLNLRIDIERCTVGKM